MIVNYDDFEEIIYYCFNWILLSNCKFTIIFVSMIIELLVHIILCLMMLNISKNEYTLIIINIIINQ